MTHDVPDRLKPCIGGKERGDAVFTWGDGSPARDFRVASARMCEASEASILLQNCGRNMIRVGVSKMTAKRISGHVRDSVFDRHGIGDEFE